ncbi:MAG: Gfo/Idh/MocA family oxidoreductase [Bradyrhizobium sp.]|uniref:Gfo/Idh/MocA family protein n=1 Tax=Bradyrhizobium sp. TaxID=376 RepID=UPI001200B992|nr:Gfo/Idh/MocA family oxidoreductase [Bradyrhizobium sp.]THD66235.1 MAG: Gfo/Idh/MocA family oxidoreductase [Bradyrhizobium sp.]
MIGIAVIGYGYWGPNLARCFAETEGCRVVAIVDPAAEALARAARHHPMTRLTANWREALADRRVDAVAIATPAATHYEIASAALRAGRHVLIEKPMADNLANARELVDLADRADLRLMIGHTLVYSSAARKIEALISSHDLGNIHYYDSTRVNLGVSRRDVSVLWDLAVHDLAIIRYLLPGEPIAISANGMRFAADAPESLAHVTLYLNDGSVAHLNVNWLAPVKTRRVTIGGSQKLLLWDDLEPSEKVKIYHRGHLVADEPIDPDQAMIDYRIGDMWSPHLSPVEPLMSEAAHFIDCVGRHLVPVTDGKFGLRIVELIEAATLSMQQRGRPVELKAHSPMQAALVSGGRNG